MRAVDPNFKVVNEAIATTDSSGNFEIKDLPDGSYMAYVYVNDNPHFFNRASALAEVKDGKVAQLQPITLGRIIRPVGPKPAEAIASHPGVIAFSWDACPGAASYELVIKRHGTTRPVLDMTSAKPEVKTNLSRLAAGALYDVRVTAKNANGEFLGSTAGAGLKPWTFKIKD